MVRWLPLSPRSKKVLSSILGQSASVWSLHVSPCACVGSLWVVLPPTVQKHANSWLGHFKLPVGVNVSVDECLSPNVNPVINWRLHPNMQRERDMHKDNLFTISLQTPVAFAVK